MPNTDPVLRKENKKHPERQIEILDARLTKLLNEFDDLISTANYVSRTIREAHDEWLRSLDKEL